MNAFVDAYEYHIAWSVYLCAGLVFCVCWWKVTGYLRHQGWRELYRGLAVVIMFTPWYVSDAREHLAPAVMVAAMDLLIGSSDNGLVGSLVLLVAIALMLAALIARQLIRRRAQRSEGP